MSDVYYSSNSDADIIVVGAGIAGLAAALAIYEHEPDLSILVLDGNDRIGGRALSVVLKVNDGDKYVFDHGGCFLSKSQTHLVSLMAKLRLPIEQNRREPAAATVGDFEDVVTSTKLDPPVFGSIADINETVRFLAKLECLSAQVSLENPMSTLESAQRDDVTMEAFIYENLQNDLCRSFFITLLRSQFGVEPSEVSLLFFLAYCNSTEGVTSAYARTKGGGKEHWIRGGAARICKKIAAIIGIDNVKINSAVTAISRSQLWTTVQTAEEQYRCRYVVMAVSPTHLLDIVFDPPLNETRVSVLETMRRRHAIHFVVTYETEFWTLFDLNGDVFCHSIDTDNFPIIHCYNITSEGHPALAGLLEPPLVEAKTSHKTKVLNHLAKYFGWAALTPLQYSERNWSDEDRLFCGSFVSYPPPRMMKNFHEIRRPIGRLFFAGAEMATYWYGHMDGAAQSGFRAAIELLYELRPQVLTPQDFAHLKPKRQVVMKYATPNRTLRDLVLMVFMTTVVAYLIIKIIITAYVATGKLL